GLGRTLSRHDTHDVVRLDEYVIDTIDVYRKSDERRMNDRIILPEVDLVLHRVMDRDDSTELSLAICLYDCLRLDDELTLRTSLDLRVVDHLDKNEFTHRINHDHPPE